MKKGFNSARMPRKTARAMFPAGRKVGDMPVFPMTTVSFMALDRLSSPLLAARTKLGFGDLAAALFVVTRPHDQLIELMGESEEAFRMACARWCEKINPKLILESAGVLVDLVAEALSTFIPERNPK